MFTPKRRRRSFAWRLWSGLVRVKSLMRKVTGSGSREIGVMDVMANWFDCIVSYVLA